ncbi:MAG: MOSC domain-containing protein [Polyangiaceae bacterium]
MIHTVERLFVHPVKSLAGVEVTHADVLAEGLRHDRRWMIVDPEGTFVSQREEPSLARVRASFDGVHLTLASDGGSVRVDRGSLSEVRTVRVWDDTFAAFDAGPGARAFLSDLLGRDVSLVAMAESEAERSVPGRTRVVDTTYAGPGHTVGFADGFPYLVVSSASVRALAERLGVEVDVRRFRPNVVVSGDDPFVEDRHATMRVNGLTFRLVKPCARCVMVNVDPSAGTTSPETLKELAAFRRDGNKVLFATNAVVTGEGSIAVGDPVTFSGP